MPHLPVLLRQHRVRAGLTQKALAERIHFSHTVISRTENPDGHYIPSGLYLSTFAKEFNLTDDEISELRLAAKLTVGLPDIESTTMDPVPITKPWRLRGGVPGWIGVGLVVVIMLFVVGFRLSESESARLYRQTDEGELLYWDAFDDADMNGWKNLNNGSWEIFEKEGDPTLGVRDQDPDAVPNAYLQSSDDWTDYTFSAHVVFESGVYEQIYLVVRSQRQPNCTGYRVGGNRLGVSIFRFDPINGCDGEVLAENIHFPLEEGRVYLMLVEAVGDRIRFFIDGDLILEARDATYSQGGVGLLAYQVKSAYFDEVEVRKTTVLD